MNLRLEYEYACFDVDPMAKRKAFTLVEILIVVSILGILAAVVIPEFHGQGILAKEAVAKEMLQTFRSQIELYSVQHNGDPPGYLNGSLGMSGLAQGQLLNCTDIHGKINLLTIPTFDYPYGPYLNKIPKNPFNESQTILYIVDPASMPANAAGSWGWIYVAVTKTIRLNSTGQDASGMDYYDY